MSMEPLKCLSSSVFDELRSNVGRNLDRYLQGDFSDLATEEGWAIPLKIEVDLGPLRQLKPANTPEIEVVNSLLVWRCLSRIPPALATEGRLWARLTHIEALRYARDRWIKDSTGEDAIKAIQTHFFGETRTKCRDDNAIGRLWWNAYIARQVMPDAHQKALKTILRRADTRSNIIERPSFSSRPKVAAGIVRAIDRNPAVVANEDAFREFMKRLNRRGSGVLFEVMNDEEIDAFMDACAI